MAHDEMHDADRRRLADDGDPADQHEGALLDAPAGVLELPLGTWHPVRRGHPCLA